MKLLFENWRQYINEQYEMKDTGVIYTALVLDDPQGLVSNLQMQGIKIPKDWDGLEKGLPHHMTILPPTKQKHRYPERFLNQKGEVKVTGYVINDKVLAVTVVTDLPTKQDIPHITIAKHPKASAKDSNELLATSKPTAFEESFTVGGVVREVAVGGTSI